MHEVQAVQSCGNEEPSSDCHSRSKGILARTDGVDWPLSADTCVAEGRIEVTAQYTKLDGVDAEWQRLRIPFLRWTHKGSMQVLRGAPISEVCFGSAKNAVLLRATPTKCYEAVPGLRNVSVALLRGPTSLTGFALFSALFSQA